MLLVLTTFIPWKVANMRALECEPGKYRGLKYIYVLAAGYSFFSDVLKSARQTVAPIITGLASCPEGLISSCLDGTVRFHPML